MSFTLDLIVNPLPESGKAAWKEIERLRENYYDDTREKSPALIKLHAELTKRYPCLCSYADDDERLEDCPWADGPMIGNFAHEMGMLAISFSRADEVVPFVIEKSHELDITVADGQSEKIYRPGSNVSGDDINKPWWKFW